MCVHPKINPSKGATSADINHGCSRLNKERKCRFRNNLDGFVADHNVIGGGGDFGLQPVLDIEELVDMGKKRSVCPFYLTRGHIADAEIIFVPYNYLFDKDARTSSLSDVQWEDSILIFDEAHNLESFASDSASFDLRGVDIGGCIAEVSRAVGYLQTMPDMAQDASVKGENLIRLKSIFLQLEHYLEEVIPAVGGSYSGEYIFEIFSKGANLTYRNHAIFLSFVKQVNDMIMEIRGDGIGGGGGGRASSTSTGTPKLDHFSGCVKRIFGTSTEGQCLAKARSYRVHVSPKNKVRSTGNMQSGGGGGFIGSKNLSNTTGRILSYWCFAPSLAMNELAGLKVRSIIVTSGTLSPLPSYSLELGLPFPHMLENSHIIAKEQISVQVIGKGVSGKLLSSAYGRRDDVEYIMELGNTIISLLKLIPGGVLIFFPSYSVMEKCVERWGGPMSSWARSQSGTKSGKNNFFQAKQRRSRAPAGNAKYCFPHSPNCYGQGSGATGSNATPWARLLAVKAVVMEPKSSSDLKEVIHEFEKAISLPKSSGCVMMGVCRGKISEGIDFADDKCRAVIITGLPFAPYLDPKVKLKREYLDGIRATMTVKPNEDGGFGATSTNATSTSRCGKILSESASLSGAEWYAQQAHRAVNQAVGRVIRHRSDYGAVLLLDSRFLEQRNQIGLSKWLRPCIEEQNGAGTAIRALVKFFRGAKMKVASASITNIKLRYENEDEGKSVNVENNAHDTENMTKIAFIKRTSGEGGSVEKPTSLSNFLMSDESLVDDGYVRPDRVIKRIELIKLSEERKKKRLLEVSERKKSGTEDLDQKNGHCTTDAASGLAALYNSGPHKTNTIGGKLISRGKVTSKVSQSSNTNISDMITSAWMGLDLEVKTIKSLPLRNKSVRVTAMRHQQIPTVNDISKKSKKKDDGARTLRLDNSRDQAKKFFEVAKQRLSPSHFDGIRKFLISMKSSGDKGDSSSYLKSARMLVDLLLEYDDCTTGFPQEAKHDCNYGHILVESLYSLLPASYCVRIEKLACQMRFDKSTFKRNCAEVLTAEELQHVCSTFPSLMFNKDRKSTKDTLNVEEKSNNRDIYLTKIEDILKMVIKGDRNQQRYILSLLYPLIPPNHRNYVKVMVNELRVEEGIMQVKRAEKKRDGEEGLNSHLFRKVQGIVDTSLKDPEDPRSPEDIAAMYEAISKAKEKKKEVSRQLQATLEKSRATFQKYSGPSRETHVSESSLTGENDATDRITTSPRPSKRARKVFDEKAITNVKTGAFDSTPKTDKITPRSNGSFDHLETCLLNAKAEAYQKKTPKLVRMNRRMEPRLPEDMMCNICKTNAKTPCMANCGHVACFKCWTQWLVRSDTCPTCRTPTMMKSLTKIAYEDKSGVGIPTMTQICGSDDDDDDELDIIGIKPNSVQ